MVSQLILRRFMSCEASLQALASNVVLS